MSAKEKDGNPERTRLENQRLGTENWRLWGPYLAERAWGTVREDYSRFGDVWEHFNHDQSRSRAYRWNEDGLGGICDERQRLCFALALWNGRDSILKERAFGLTGNQGNRGEDVKEYYFYQDATPSHSYLHYVYKYPHQAYPYERLVDENRRRGRDEAPFNLLDTGVLEGGRYWDVEVRYAKSGPERIHIAVIAYNRGEEVAELHVLPQLWFRNNWSWGDAGAARPHLRLQEPPEGCAWAVEAEHESLGRYFLYGLRAAEDLLFTENDSNDALLWGVDGSDPYVKDAFHRRVLGGEDGAVNPRRVGSKFAPWYRSRVPGGRSTRFDFVLCGEELDQPFARHSGVLARRKSEADVFYDRLLPEATPEDNRIMRQALAGMIWNKQFYHYDLDRWLTGDLLPPPRARRSGRNAGWRHLKAADIISMPDCWEYPWFAAWDLAFHCAPLALIDVDFAKNQIELMVSERYLHPKGQIPAYEWRFDDVNPPVHGWGALKVFRAERVQRGQGDLRFLQRVFHKLLLNYGWWLNRKDREGHNLFEGGFLGLDNISVYDRSSELPYGYSLKQADATGWMAMFSLNMTVMALEIACEETDYEEIAIQCYQQFLAIANAIAGGDGNSISLWDAGAGFFKDVLVTPSGECRYIDVYSLVGLIPLFACEVIDGRLLRNVPRFRTMLREHKGGLFQGSYVCACPEWENERGEHLLALVDHSMLPRILDRLLDENQFLSRYGIRSVSRIHADYRDLGDLPGLGRVSIEYVPGESVSPLFGGNSNWRGPVWLPMNYKIIQALEKYHRFLGDGFTVEAGHPAARRLNLREVANLIAGRLVDLYRRDDEGWIPALRGGSSFQNDPHWKERFLFYEYFHAETGQGLGAAHQTGWTGLMANLVMRRYRRDTPLFWRQHTAES